VLLRLREVVIDEREAEADAVALADARNKTGSS
jgi:hypothetical protein